MVLHMPICPNLSLVGDAKITKALICISWQHLGLPFTVPLVEWPYIPVLHANCEISQVNIFLTQYDMLGE